MVSRCVIRCPEGRSMNDINNEAYHCHFAFFNPKNSTLKKEQQAVCLLCNKGRDWNSWDSAKILSAENYQNLRIHLSRCHPEVLLYRDIDDQEKKEWSNRWVELESNDKMKTIGSKEHNTFFNKRARGMEAYITTDGKTSKSGATEIPNDREVRDIMIKGIVLSNSPIAYYNNPGYKHIICGLTKRNEHKGLSPSTTTRDLEELFVSMKSGKRERLESASKLFLNMKRPFNIEHDHWSKYGKSFLGIRISGMAMFESKWELFSFAVANVQQKATFDAKTTFGLIKDELLSGFQINVDDLFSCTQDTTGSSFEVFTETPVQQIGCVGHTFQLVEKHGTMKCDVLNNIFADIRDVMGVLKESPKRLDLLTQAQEQEGKPVLRPILDAKTRWGTNHAMAVRMIKILQDVKKVLESNDQLFSKNQQKIDFQNKLDAITDAIPLLDVVLPVLNSINAWVQILSGDSVTISVVRLAITNVQAILKEVSEVNKKRVLQRESELKTNVESFVESFTKNLNWYFFQEENAYYDFWVFRVSEYLDPRFVVRVNDDDLEEICKDIIDFGKEIFTKQAVNANNNNDKNKFNSNNNDNHNSNNNNSNNNNEKSKIKLPSWMTASRIETPRADNEIIMSLMNELDIYKSLIINLVQTNGVSKLVNSDPLEFWAHHKKKLPLLSQIAAVILSCRPCSTGVERQFSGARRVVDWTRASLGPKMINILVLLNDWMRGENKKKDKSDGLHKRILIALDTPATPQLENPIGCDVTATLEEEEDSGQVEIPIDEVDYNYREAQSDQADPQLFRSRTGRLLKPKRHSDYEYS